jgi:hypothetical protein
MDSRVPELGSVKTIESMGGKVGSNCVSIIIDGEEFKGAFCLAMETTLNWNKAIR